MKQEHICKQKKCALKFSDPVYCIHSMIIHTYIYVSFSFTCQTQQKETSNNSLTFHCAYLSLFGRTASLHVYFLSSPVITLYLILSTWISKVYVLIHIFK
jgi:hypothetical protein